MCEAAVEKVLSNDSSLPMPMQRPGRSPAFLSSVCIMSCFGGPALLGDNISVLLPFRTIQATWNCCAVATSKTLLNAVGTATAHSVEVTEPDDGLPGVYRGTTKLRPYTLGVASRSSVVRVFRAAATLTTGVLVTSWIRAHLSLAEARDTAQRQLDAEMRKKGAKVCELGTVHPWRPDLHTIYVANVSRCEECIRLYCKVLVPELDACCVI